MSEVQMSDKEVAVESLLRELTRLSMLFEIPYDELTASLVAKLDYANQLNDLQKEISIPPEPRKLREWEKKAMKNRGYKAVDLAFDDAFKSSLAEVEDVEKAIKLINKKKALVLALMDLVEETEDWDAE